MHPSRNRRMQVWEQIQEPQLAMMHSKSDWWLWFGAETWLQRMFLSKMGVSSQVSLLGGRTMKGFSASDHYDKAKQIALTVLSTPWEKNTSESAPKHVLVEKGFVINICFWKMAYNSDFIVQHFWNKNIFLRDSLSKIVVLFFFLFFLQQLWDS